MALKTTNKNRKKPSIVEAKVEIKHMIDDPSLYFNDKRLYNDEFIDTKINYKAFFGLIALLALVSLFVI